MRKLFLLHSWYQLAIKVLNVSQIWNYLVMYLVKVLSIQNIITKLIHCCEATHYVFVHYWSYDKLELCHDKSQFLFFQLYHNVWYNELSNYIYAFGCLSLQFQLSSKYISNSLEKKKTTFIAHNILYKNDSKELKSYL